MAQIEQLPAAAVPQESSEAAEWLRNNSIVLAAIALIAGQLWWKAHLLTQFYFRQDDFEIMDHALSSRFSLGFLFSINGGQGRLTPGDLGVTWVMVRLSLYDWTLASIFTIALLAAAGFAMLRVLWLIFGKRPAILIPLAIYLFSPLTLPGLSFWATTMLWLPLQVSILMALGSHMKYLRSGRFGHAIAAAAWLAVGMLFDEQGMLVPLLVFAVTAGYFVPGGWLRAAREAIATYWQAWVLYGVLMVSYIVLFVIELQSSTQQPHRPGLFSGVLALISTMSRVSFVSAAFGGPWSWYSPGGDYGYAVETTPATQICWALAIIVIGLSLWYRAACLAGLADSRLLAPASRSGAGRNCQSQCHLRHAPRPGLALPGRRRAHPGALPGPGVLAGDRRGAPIPQRDAIAATADAGQLRGRWMLPGQLHLDGKLVPQGHFECRSALVYRHRASGARRGAPRHRHRARDHPVERHVRRLPGQRGADVTGAGPASPEFVPDSLHDAAQRADQ